MQDEPALTEERRVQVALGDRYRELNRIMARIRRRISGQPKEREQTRILELRREIAAIKRGETLPWRRGSSSG